MNYRVWLSDESRRKEVLDITRGLVFRNRHCYTNAYKCVMADGSGSTEYVEGYLVHPRFGKMIHAWCRFKDTDIHFDPTPSYLEDREDPNVVFCVVRVYSFEEHDRILFDRMESGCYWPYPLTTGLDTYCLLTSGEDIPFDPADYTKEAIAKMVGKAG